VDSCILLPNCEIGRHSRIRRAIIGADVILPESSNVGFSLEEDRERGYTVTESGVVVVPPANERHVI
jgi:glucose-1-phosphate adenylyltransferase